MIKGGRSLVLYCYFFSFFFYSFLWSKSFKDNSIASFFHEPLADFLKDSLEGFLNRMSDDALIQEGFRSFYSNFLERHAKLSPRKQKKELKKIYNYALERLEKYDTEWFMLIKPYKKFLRKSKFQCPEVHFFLVRYAQYQKYTEYLLEKNAGVWSSCKSYLKRIFSK